MVQDSSLHRRLFRRGRRGWIRRLGFTPHAKWLQLVLSGPGCKIFGSVYTSCVVAVENAKAPTFEQTKGEEIGAAL